MSSDDYYGQGIHGHVSAEITNFPDPKISRRDYFAAAALSGILAGNKIEDVLRHGASEVRRIPGLAWLFADAMLKLEET